MIKRTDFENDLKSAIKAGQQIRKNTLRMVLTAIKLAEIENRGDLDEGELLHILQKQAKMRRESIDEARTADRPDLLPPLEEELAILESYLPEPLSREEIAALASQAIQEVGASGPQDMGKVMKGIMSQVEGRADGKVVSGIVRELLSEA